MPFVPTIAERLQEAAGARAGKLSVQRVCIGLSYTAVQLEDGSCGLAMTYSETDDDKSCCSIREQNGPLAGRPARELLGRLGSEHPVERAVGLACANALLNRPMAGERAGDVLEVVDLRPGDRVGMVGCFWPMLDELRRRVKELLVFERQTEGEDFLLPAEDAPRLLPGCQAALITSSSLLNGTLDGLLNACHGLREVVLLGASTPLAPAVFADTPVSWLCGVQVTDADQVLRTVCEGGGMRRFQGLVRKVCLANGCR